MYTAYVTKLKNRQQAPTESATDVKKINEIT